MLDSLVNLVAASWLDHAALFIGFVVAVVAVLFKTKYEGRAFPAAITPFGWTLAVLATLTFAISGWRTLASEEKRQQVRYWAFLEIEQAVLPIYAIYLADSDPPEVTDRFALAPLIEGKNGDGFSSICAIELNEATNPWFDRGTSPAWAELITSNIVTMRDSLRDILLNYRDILSPRTIDLIAAMRNDPWVVFLQDSKRRRDRRVQAPSQARGPHTLCKGPSQLEREYAKMATAFGERLKTLEAELKSEIVESSLGRKRCDPIPLFYTQISGLIYVPKRC